MKSKAALAIAAFRHSFDPKLTHRVLADRYGVAEMTTNRIENGKRKLPSPDLVRAFDDDGIACIDDFYRNVPRDQEAAVQAAAACLKCQRPFSSPAVRDCLDSACPRALFPDEQRTTSRRKAEGQAA